MEKLLYRDRKKERLPRIGEDKRKGKPGYAIARTLLQAFSPSQPLAWIQPVGIGTHSAVKHNNNDSTASRESSIQNSEFKIYPNPANNTINITYEIAGKNLAYSMAIFDMTGNKVNTYPLPTGQSSVIENVSEIASGFYIYTINNGNAIVQRGKLIITR